MTQPDGYAQPYPYEEPRVPAETLVYTRLIWAIVLVPLLIAVILLFVDYPALMSDSISGARSGVGMMLSPGYWAIQAMSLLSYAAIVVMAYFDWRELGRRGFVQPFHWAWAFLGTLVYVVGRSVVVYSRSGRGLTPIWVLLAVTVFGMIVGGIKAAQLMQVMMTSFLGAS